MPKSDEDWGDNLLEASVEFVDNPEPRCACVLLLDSSGSMSGEPVRELNKGLAAFKADLAADAVAKRRVEIAVVTFGGAVKVVQDFVIAEEFQPPQLTAAGLTPMGGAILAGLDLLEVRKAQYKSNGVPYHRPWVFLITDGAPEGEPPYLIGQAAERVEADENAGRIAFFAVGVEDADMDQLATIAVRRPVKLQGLKFADMFLWLSRSMKSASTSKHVGDRLPLPPVDWSVV